MALPLLLSTLESVASKFAVVFVAGLCFDVSLSLRNTAKREGTTTACCLRPAYVRHLPFPCSTVPILSDASRSVKSLIDSWAIRFMEEMDYTMEADNADRFAREMATHKTLGSAIKVPSVSTCGTPVNSTM